MMKHLTFEKLVDKFEGRLGTAEAELVTSHLNECSACNADHRKLEDFFGYIGDKPSEEVPQAATARILNIYQRTPKNDSPKESLMSRLGVLVFDDWTTALNERFAGMDSRQMLFRADDIDIDLRIEFVGDKCIVTGQVFPHCPIAEVILRSQDTSVNVKLNDLGEFSFDPVKTGEYSLRIKNDEVDLVIDTIPLHI